MGSDTPSTDKPLVPVTLLTGFLGSGKTTLLKRLLEHPGLENTAVIVNEFGEIGLDHALVTEGEEDVVLLNAGCLCCTVSNSLAETLSDLWFRRARAEIPAFQRVVIETTGLADPAPILHLLMTDRVVSAVYRVDGVVTTVDALHGAEQLDEHEEALKQVAVADRIALTKTDLASPETADATRVRLHRINPGAEIFDAPHGRVDPERLMNIGVFDPAAKGEEVARWLHDEAYRRAELRNPDDHKHSDHKHDVNRHDERIRAFCIYIDFPVSWAGYASWVELMREFKAANLLRVKGLIAIEGGSRPYLVQGVQHVFSPPLRLKDWPSDDRRSCLIFITRDLDRDVVEASLEALKAPAGTQRPASLDEVINSPRRHRA